MKGSRICVACGGLAAVVALSVALAGTSASGAAAPAAQPGRSSQAAAVEAAMASTNITGKLQATLGNSFGGVWFEPSTAKLHVGVTSAAAGRTAGALAAEAGMAGAVVASPVASSWRQLQAAQDHWDNQITGLIEAAEAATSLAPDRNAVEIELGSTVPSSRVSALEREAAGAPVRVDVSVLPYADLGAIPQARCNAFAKQAAFCNPTLAAGVSFDGPVVGGKRKTCTAGPTVISKKAEEEVSTYVLTAGHCIEGAGGIGKSWFAYNREGEPKGEREVGVAADFLNGETDVGLVEVTTAYWASSEGLVPVVPAIAPWNQKEPEPFSVVGQKTPTLNTNACLSGQISAISCGKIIKTNQTITVGKVTTKNLIEVEGATSEEGDSGGPWFSETEFKETPPRGYVEGTHVGRKGETGNPVFEPLSISFADLKKEKGWELELLTTANQIRHTSNLFHSEVERTYHFGEQATENVLGTTTGNIKCKKTTLSADVTGTEKAANDFAVTGIDFAPSYGECTAFGAAATVTTTGCQYRLTASGETAGDAEVVCEAGKSIAISVPSANCSVMIGTQTPGESAVEYKNEGAGATRVIRITWKVSKLAYTVAGPGTACGTVGAHTDGTYTGSILQKGFKNATHTEQAGVWAK